MNSEPPQHSLEEDESDDIELSELETHVPVLCRSKSISVAPSDYIP